MTTTAKKLAAVLSLLVLLGITAVTASIGSPSEIDVEANDGIFDNYDGEVITFRWTADTISGSEEIRVTNSEITDRLREGRVSDDFTMEIDNTISEAKYAVRDGGLRDGYSVDYQRETWYWGRTWEAMPEMDERIATYNTWGEENCDDIDGDGRNTWRYNEWQDGTMNSRVNGEVVCATQGSKQADIAELQSTPTEVMGATFTVMGDSVTITNEYQGSDSSSQGETVGNSAKIDLLGGYEAGYNFPEPDNEYVAFTNSDGFYLISRNDYRELQNYMTYAEEGALRDIMDVSPDDREGRMQQYEQQSQDEVELRTSHYTQSEFYDEQINWEGSSMANGVLRLEGDRNSVVPEFNVFVKGTALEYVIPDADPYIASVSSVEIEEGDPEYVDVTVGNDRDATGDGSFDVYLTDCSEGVQWSGSATSVRDLAPGETETVRFQLSFGGDFDTKEVGGVCTAEVQNAHDRDETDAAEFSWTGIQTNDCEPPGGEYFEFDDDGNYAIYQCDDEGQNTDLVETCDTDEKAEEVSTDEYECVEIDDEDTGGGGTAPSDPTDTDNEACLIDTAIHNPVAEDTPIRAVCVDTGILARLRFVVILVSGLATGFVGYTIGRFIDGERRIRGPNRYTKQRQVDRRQRGNSTSVAALIGSLGGFAVGAAIGWYLGLWAFLVILLLLILKFVSPV